MPNRTTQVIVGPGEFGMVKRGEKKELLTYGATQCSTVVMATKNKIVMGHFTDRSNIRFSLELMRSQFDENDKPTVYLVPGVESKLVPTIKGELNDMQKKIWKTPFSKIKKMKDGWEIVASFDPKSRLKSPTITYTGKSLHKDKERSRKQKIHTNEWELMYVKNDPNEPNSLKPTPLKPTPVYEGMATISDDIFNDEAIENASIPKAKEQLHSGYEVLIPITPIKQMPDLPYPLNLAEETENRDRSLTIDQFADALKQVYSSPNLSKVVHFSKKPENKPQLPQEEMEKLEGIKQEYSYSKDNEGNFSKQEGRQNLGKKKSQPSL